MNPVVRVVSYNVHGLRDDRLALVHLLRAVRPDVLLVQDGPRRLRWRTPAADLANRLGMFYVDGGRPSGGNILAVSQRVRVHASTSLRYAAAAGHRARGAVIGRLSVGDVRFAVVGTHLDPDAGRRADQVAHLTATVSDVDTPAILAGDLAEEWGGPTWTALAAGRADAAGDDPSPTYPSSAPRQRVDAIFVDERLAVRAYRVAVGPQVRRASDHTPVIADIALGATSRDGSGG